jgi:hypothetical protein
MSENYPANIPSGITILPRASGVNSIGSSSYRFNSTYSNNYYGTNATFTLITGTNFVITSGGSVTFVVSGTSSIGSVSNPASNIYSNNYSGTNATLNTINGYTPRAMSYNVIPIGSINGSNTVFSLPNNPIAGIVIVYQSGLRLVPSGTYGSYDYMVTSSGFTMVVAPTSGTKILVDYVY